MPTWPRNAETATLETDAAAALAAAVAAQATADGKQAAHANLTALSAVTPSVPNAGKVFGVDPSGNLALITVAVGLASLLGAAWLSIEYQFAISPADTLANVPAGVMSPSWS